MNRDLEGYISKADKIIDTSPMMDINSLEVIGLIDMIGKGSLYDLIRTAYKFGVAVGTERKKYPCNGCNHTHGRE